MATNSAIEWTGDTWNPVAGCSLVSPGCTNCYAMRMAARLEAMRQVKYAGTTKKVGRLAVWTGKINLDEDALTIPLRRKKPTTYFVNSMSDLFHEGVPFEFIDKVFAVMALTPHHTYQILTKRAERMAEYMSDHPVLRKGPGAGGAAHPNYHVHREAQHLCNQLTNGDVPGKLGPKIADAKWTVPRDVWANFFAHPAGLPWPLPNVHVGVSVEDEKRKDRIDRLRAVPAAVRFLSLEPLIENLRTLNLEGIGWVIVGGESGPGARPCCLDWIRPIVRQCREECIPVFVKQLGRVPYEGELMGDRRIHLNDPKGGDIAEWASLDDAHELCVREMPVSAVPA